MDQKTGVFKFRKQDTFPYHDLNTKIIRLIDLSEEIDRNKLVGLEKQRPIYLMKQLNLFKPKLKC